MRGANLKLQGQFKFDLYRPNGELIRSLEVDNFITNTGILYPFHFAFADCFRYLSLGDGNANNSVETPFTTGLATPNASYQYVGGRSSYESTMTGSNYTNPGLFGAGCGYSSLNNGASLIRQWTLPDATGGIFSSAHTFREFMVSPGRPYVTGEGGVKFCSCNEYDDFATGLDCSATADYYRWLKTQYGTYNHEIRLDTCDAIYAFARVVQDIEVEANSVLTVTYKLNILMDTGINYTSLYYDRGDLVANWNGPLNMVSSITQPGIMLINDGTIYGSSAPDNPRLQHFNYADGGTPYSFESEYGESFVPPHGMPLEPSTFFRLNDANNQNIVAYLTSDNTQFIANARGGKLDNPLDFAPWNFWQEPDIEREFSYGDFMSSGVETYLYIGNNPSSGHFLDDVIFWSGLGYLQTGYGPTSGVKPFRNDNDAAIISGQNYWSQNPNEYNIRTSSGKFPLPTDITGEADGDATYYRSVRMAQPRFIYNLASSGLRDALVSYAISFEGYRSTAAIQSKGLVLAYRDLSYGQSFGLGDRVNMVPFFDALLSGKSGESSQVFVPRLVSGEVDGVTGVWIGDIVNEYNTIEGYSNSIYPIINTSLRWSAPCPNGVNGCP